MGNRRKMPKSHDTLKSNAPDLTNTLVMTVRSPSNATKTLCKQLRRVFAPNCLSKLEINPRMQDVIDVADQLYAKQIVYISEGEIRIACMPQGPTYRFSIIEYESEYKNYPADIYRYPAFITTEGKSSCDHVFQHFGKNETGFRRALHFCFDEDLTRMRHYCTTVEELEEKFKVSMREIGPRLTLRLKDVSDGVFREMNVERSRTPRRSRNKGN